MRERKKSSVYRDNAAAISILVVLVAQVALSFIYVPGASNALVTLLFFAINFVSLIYVLLKDEFIMDTSFPRWAKRILYLASNYLPVVLFFSAVRHLLLSTVWSVVLVAFVSFIYVVYFIDRFRRDYPAKAAAAPVQSSSGQDKTAIRQAKLFMLDMDGTFYLGNELLPGAKEFLAACKANGVPYTFLTNNSSKNADAYLQKLASLGVEATPQEMFTSGDATLLYLAQQGISKDILLIGTPSLEQQFEAEGYNIHAQTPAAVVLGFDTTLTYEKLTQLCNAVRSGLPYIATHPDFNCPVPGGYIPDIGAVIAFVKAATGREPDEIIGKPNAGIAKAAAARFGVELADICMVGDRLYTDIALGQSGVQTALVLSGESTLADLAGSDVVPDYVFENLLEMAGILAPAQEQFVKIST